MKIVIGSDHGGYLAKAKIIEHLEKLGHEVIDCGTDSLESTNYATYAYQTALKVKNRIAERGIVVCTSGVGVSIAANKTRGIRCALVYNNEIARLCREHNNANMIAIGAKYFKEEEILEFVDIFLKTEFEGGRHQARVETFKQIEDNENI